MKRQSTDWEESFLSHISGRDNTQNYTHMVVVGNRNRGKGRESGERKRERDRSECGYMA